MAKVAAESVTTEFGVFTAGDELTAEEAKNLAKLDESFVVDDKDFVEPSAGGVNRPQSVIDAEQAERDQAILERHKDEKVDDDDDGA